MGKIIGGTIRISPGRTDKRYCDDICRARATRRRNREGDVAWEDQQRRYIVHLIRRNHSLLKKAMNGRDEWIADFAQLYDDGFHREFITSSKVMLNGITRYYCFEIGWEEMEGARLWLTLEPRQLYVLDQKGEDISFGPAADG